MIQREAEGQTPGPLTGEAAPKISPFPREIKFERLTQRQRLSVGSPSHNCATHTRISFHPAALRGCKSIKQKRTHWRDM